MTIREIIKEAIIECSGNPFVSGKIDQAFSDIQTIRHRDVSKKEKCEGHFAPSEWFEIKGFNRAIEQIHTRIDEEK